MRQGQGCKILLVEDDKTLADMYELRLKAEDFEVVKTANGKQALAEIPHFQPDLILLDILMPEMDGIQVLTFLRSQKETADIPVLILTALSQSKDRAIGMEAGADDYIVKSEVMPHEVVERVKEAIEVKDIAKHD